MEEYLTIAFALIAVGAALLAGEFFLPTGGFLVVAAGGCFAIAVGLIWYSGTQTEALVATIGLCVGLPAAGMGVMQGWKRLAIRSGLNPEEAGGSVTSAVPELVELDKLKGRYGKTATPMRPAGSVVIDGRRVDALSEGMMIDTGTWVKCVAVRAGRVIVRQVDAPSDLRNFNLDDPKDLN